VHRTAQPKRLGSGYCAAFFLAALGVSNIRKQGQHVYCNVTIGRSRYTRCYVSHWWLLTGMSAYKFNQSLEACQAANETLFAAARSTLPPRAGLRRVISDGRIICHFYIPGGPTVRISAAGILGTKLPVGVHLGQAKADLSFCCHMVHGHTYTQDATDMCIPNACPRLLAVDVSGLSGSHSSLIEKVPHFQVIMNFFANC
jgi:hypothetical protein